MILDADALIQHITNKNGRTTPNKNDHDQANEEILVVIFINGTNQDYNKYKAHLRDSYLEGNDVYLKSVHDAYPILNRRSEENNGSETIESGMALVTTGEQEDNGNLFTTTSQSANNVKCYNCQQLGYYSNQCPERNQTPSQNHDNDNSTNSNIGTTTTGTQFTILGTARIW
mmetsp:Transcript_13928/g.20062  ORF Transcript_13928/g.20062 Transcript_13928/m.20062 type:complete len:172 (-) Transcript_13928:274-789(-)